MIIHGIVRLPFTTIQTIFESFTTKFPTSLISQHDADEETKTTHCHFLVDISGSFGNADSLRKNYFKKLANYDILEGKNMELKNKTQDTKQLYNRDLLAIYIIKGVNKPLAKGSYFTDDIIDFLASKWVRTLPPPPAEQSEAPKASLPRAPSRPSDWKLLNEMLDEKFFNDKSFVDLDSVINPTETKKLVIKILRRNNLIPHPRRIGDFVGAMYNMLDDSNPNYSFYDEVSIRQHMYKFSQL